MEKLINIGKLTKSLNLINKSNNKPSTHILRYWEKEFKQIKPLIMRNRRYYPKKQIDLIKLIKYLLKDKHMKINGVKNILNSKINNLDDYQSYSLKAEYLNNNIKLKSKLILEKIKKIKNYGKKNTP
tara:strand:+ start:3684 stop:4064 length:381 start_codon:yes stop_codon:yes gene_type:complete